MYFSGATLARLAATRRASTTSALPLLIAATRVSCPFPSVERRMLAKRAAGRLSAMRRMQSGSSILARICALLYSMLLRALTHWMWRRTLAQSPPPRRSKGVVVVVVVVVVLVVVVGFFVVVVGLGLEVVGLGFGVVT